MKATIALAVFGLALAANGVRAEGSTDHQDLDKLIKATKSVGKQAADSGVVTKDRFDFLSDYSPN